MEMKMQHKLELTEDDAYLLCGDILLVVYPAGDCDVIRGDSPPEKLHRALYDYYQCSDELKDGDEIALPDGTVFARCEGVHVVRVD
jgi:hypothetical protein